MRHTSGMPSCVDSICSHRTSTSILYLMSAYSLKCSRRLATCIHVLELNANITILHCRHLAIFRHHTGPADWIASGVKIKKQQQRKKSGTAPYLVDPLGTPGRSAGSLPIRNAVQYQQAVRCHRVSYFTCYLRGVMESYGVWFINAAVPVVLSPDVSW